MPPECPVPEPKPWAHLRKYRSKPPIEPGDWVPVNSARIYYKGAKPISEKVGFVFGYEDNPQVYFTTDGLRQAAEFFNELADQIDGK